MSRRVLPGLEPPDPVLDADLRSRLDRVEEALAKSVRVETSGLLSETASHLVNAGGKRFRAMLVLLAGHFGDPDDPRLIPGSVSIELVHLATLYHDDVIDEADARRGAPSANARWDNTVAILTGDYLFARASEISTELGTDVCRLLARTIAVLCDGQIREVDASARVEQQVADYLGIIDRKTAALIATSCRLGGMLSDATPEHVDVLESFGQALGMAYQLSDDIMDITASQLELGKEPGQDMKEGVYTLPVLHALANGPRETELAAILSHGAPDGELLDHALDIVRSGGAIEHARAAVRDEVGRAVGLAERLPAGTAQTALIQLAEFLAARCGAGVGRMNALLRYAPLVREAVHKPLGTYFESYAVLLAVVTAGALLVLVAFTTAKLVAPHKPGREKLTTYECGIDPVGEGWSQSQVRYYIYGFLFVIFDVESVFLFPGPGCSSVSAWWRSRRWASSSASSPSACSTRGERGC